MFLDFDVQLLQDCFMFNLFHKRLSESRSDLWVETCTFTVHGMLSKFDISPKMDGWKLEDYFPFGTRKLVTFSAELLDFFDVSPFFPTKKARSQRMALPNKNGTGDIPNIWMSTGHSGRCLDWLYGLQRRFRFTTVEGYSQASSNVPRRRWKVKDPRSVHRVKPWRGEVPACPNLQRLIYK